MSYDRLGSATRTARVNPYRGPQNEFLGALPAAARCTANVLLKGHSMFRTVCVAVAVFVCAAELGCNQRAPSQSSDQRARGTTAAVTASGGAADVCGIPAPATVSTRLLYVGATSGEYAEPLSLQALLTDASGNALAGKTISFSLGGQVASGKTDANGLAQAGIAATFAPGMDKALVATAAVGSLLVGALDAGGALVSALGF